MKSPFVTKSQLPIRRPFQRVLHIAVTALLSSFMLPAATGCVALNIPSERLHDASDDGGWLGGWHRPKKLGVPDVSHPLSAIVDDTAPAHFPATSATAMTLSLASTCWGDATPVYDPAADADAQAAADEIPWPKFHPVPTRPVFGGSVSSY